MRVFSVINNGDIVIQLCNPKDDLDGILHVLREGYMKSANTFAAFAMNKPEAAKARLEYEKIVKAVLFAGISVVARDVRSKRIIGYCLNHIQSRLQCDEKTFYEKFRDSSDSELLKSLLDFRIAKDKQIDLFEMYNVDHYIEFVWVTTIPEYRKLGVAQSLVESSLIMAREIAAGKCPETMDERIKDRIPKIVFTSSSSKYSSTIVDKLGFVAVKIFPFNELKANGIPVSEKVSSDHTESKLMVFKL
ncbi:uncharacterized protein LOC132255823 [Phlebotomus argentipes]|uniref:uncharacterized protein LOC132255823 n=1 Tax=Phlebotomus argentipes TaxID=94469 RepID=UPI0028929E12|nr:uncharacterized protein LOC132255823 [Phlebotomus argentipes]